MQGASNIVQVASNPPYTTINQLVTIMHGLHVHEFREHAANDQEAQRLIGLFLDILRELQVEHLANEMEERYRGERQEANIRAPLLRRIYSNTV